MRKSVVSFLLLFLIAPLVAFASVGVGIGTGKIIIDKPLKPGGLYNLPPLAIFNTGDESSDYGIWVAYHTDQPQLRPAQEWFSFNPSLFHLEPGKSELVEAKLNLPVKANPGDYFAYLEGRPVVKTELGTTSIGIAAATKLYFTIIPANLWQAITFRISSLFIKYAPWTLIVLIAIVLATIAVLIKRTFSFQLGIKRK